MTITQFGRVELDPSLVPIPASARRSSEPSFQDRLDTVSETPQPHPRREPRAAEEQDIPVPIDPRTPVENAEPAPRQGAPTRSSEPLPSQAPAAPPGEEAPLGLQTGHLVATGNPGQRAESQKPTQLVETGLPLASGDSKPQKPVIQLSPTAVQATATAPGNQNGQPPAKISVGSVTNAKASVVASRTQPGYRTMNHSTLQMAEAARDSIFRQVALRVNGGGGEMRLLLDPPGLGQLDLRVIVDKAGAVHLSMIAERPELAQVLDKHMAELKQTLHNQGLSVAHAEVRARSEQARDWEHGDQESSAEDQSDDSQDWTGTALRRAGYITAEGLDFWV